MPTAHRTPHQPAAGTIHRRVASTVHQALHRPLQGLAHLMPRAGGARATMFGLAHRADRYQSLTERFTAPIHARVCADLTAEVAAGSLPPGARVLDVGTGPGMLPLRIAAACPQLRVDGVDLSPEMIEVARRNAAAAQPAAGGEAGRVGFAVADVARLPFPDGTFDLVVSTISQHHWDDPAAGLQELARVLRPGGRAWIDDFRWALRRAVAAAGGLPPGVRVDLQRRLPASSRLSPIARLVLTREPAARA